MISMEIIDRNWSSIVPVHGQNIARRADADHPLDFFIGYNEDGYMQMMLISDEEIQVPESSRQVLVRSNKRTDGQYAICFILVNSSLRDTFVSLCWDIIASTFSEKNKKAGNEAAIRRFGIWMIMLAKGNDKGLSESSAKGLLGELLVLQRICIPIFGAPKAINGWIGPLRADRDFEYDEGWFETKSVSSESETISISSFDQLDIDREGKLIVCKLDKTRGNDPQGISLGKIEKELLEQLGEDADTRNTLQIRLMLSGYKENDPHADDMYLFKGFDSYAVKGDFPRIRKSLLPAAIQNGEYKLEIAALNPWRE